MSLINEALLKARAQATLRADQDSQPETLIDRSTPFVQPRERRTGTTAVLGLSLAALAAALFVSIKAMVQVPATARAEWTPMQAAPAPIMDDLAFVEPEPVAVEQPAPVEQVQPEPQVAPAVEETPIAPVVAAEPEPAPQPVVIEPASPPDPLALLRPLEGKTFIKTVDVPAEGDQTHHLQLDGIVWSNDAPVALINSTLARPGDDLLNVHVVRVERKRVELESRGVRFYLRLP